jgi:uncharacterized damage-inducible protein DinB
MMLNDIRTLHAYNTWASTRIFDALASVSDEQYLADMKSSHGGIHSTLVHMVGAEKVWLERFQGEAQPFLSQNPPGSLAGLRGIWDATRAKTTAWLDRQSDQSLEGTFTLTTVKGDVFTHVFWQAFQHVVNHSTYHRGQVVTMMRQLGIKPPSTDLALYYRETRG